MAFKNLRERLAGVVAIPVTPFNERGGIDEAAVTSVLQRMTAAGIEVVTPNGNTSEFYALSAGEARQAVELTVAAVGADCTVLVGVGHAIRDAISAAEHARDAGAQAIMVHQPVHPFVTLDGWVDYHREIAAAVPELGVVPYLRSVRIDGRTVARLADVAPNLVAVKYAVPDPVRFASVLRDCNRETVVWIAGLAELSAPGFFAVGATGFTSGFANIAPEISLGMLSDLRAGDYARAMEAWELIRPFEELRAHNDSENNVAVVKESLAQLGLCRRDIRPPSSLLGEAERAAVTAMLRSWSPDARVRPLVAR